MKVRGRRLDRLLIGNFGTWEEAYEQARKLQDKGLVEEFAILRLPFAIELSDLTDLQVASRKVRDLESRGFSTYLQATEHGSWRLLAGAFSSSEEAELALTALPAEMGPGRVIWR